jgi:hypothetical protein
MSHVTTRGDSTKLSELQTIIASRDRVIEQAKLEVRRLEQTIATAQARYALAVSEDDASQGSKLARLTTLRQEYQEAMIRLEALQGATKEARSSEKLAALCVEVEQEARATIEQLSKEKASLIEELLRLEEEVLALGAHILDIEGQQQAIYTETSTATKAVRGRKASPKLPGPGTFIDRDMPFRTHIVSANTTRRQERPWRHVGPTTMLYNR